MDRVGNGYRLCVRRYGWIGWRRVVAGITSRFEVPEENDNGRRLVDFYAERGLCVYNTYFEHEFV